MGQRVVSVDDRRAFLMWFGSNHEFKDPAAVDVLRFLLSDADRLARLRIIEDCSYLRPLVVITAFGQRQPGLLYQTAAWSTGDATAILMDLSLAAGSIHLSAHFPRRGQAKPYLAAREENVKPAAAHFGPAVVDLETTQLLAGLGLMAKRAELLLLIDQSLERRDRASFSALVTELKRLPRQQDLAAAGRGERG